MRLHLRILKSYEKQQIPSCFLYVHHKKQSYFYSINTPKEVFKDWRYYKVSQSESIFKAFYTRFDIQHISGIFGLVSALEKNYCFQFFGCNMFLKYYQYLTTCFGIKIIKMSAASFQKNDSNYQGLLKNQQFEKFIQNFNTKISYLQQIKEKFQGEQINCARDLLKFDDTFQLNYYEDECLKVYAIQLYQDDSPYMAEKSAIQKFAYHFMEKNENKFSINTEKLSQLPQVFHKALFKHGKVSVDDKIYNLEDFQQEEQISQLLILELRSDEEVDQFITNPYLKTELFQNLDLIVHLSPKEVLLNPKYTQFIKENTNANHLITASGFYSMITEKLQFLPQSFLSYNKHLNQLFPGIYPVMNPNYFFPYIKGADSQHQLLESQPFYHEKVKLALSFEIVHMKHKNSFYQYQPPQTIVFDNNLFDQFLQNQQINKLRQQLLAYQEQKTFEQRKCYVSNPELYPEIITLGTSSSLSTQLRNVSSYLLKVNQNSSILLDCGHGTMFQLQKQFGTHDERQLFEQVRNIKMIIISHHHSDHHFGIIEFLQMRKELFDQYGQNNEFSLNKLLIIVPELLQNYLVKFIGMVEELNAIVIPHNNVSPNIIKYQSNLQFTNEQLLNALTKDNTDDDDNMLTLEQNDKELLEQNRKQKEYHLKLFSQLASQMSLKHIYIFPIFHCFGSSSIKIEYNNGKTLIYSGDGRINNKHKSLFEKCDFLIHECTFSGQNKAEASQKRHSTFDEVVKFAYENKVECLILSHFSPSQTEQQISRNISPKNYQYSFYEKKLENYINSKTIFATDNLIINEKNKQNLIEASRVIFKICSTQN
ncbi:hypothetical protein ABPG72_002040 [Tetrahymena utriculariae]